MFASGAPKPTPSVVQVIVHYVVRSPLSTATLIAAIASLLTAIIALVALVVGGKRAKSALELESRRASEEGERARLAIGINNLWKLIEQWDAHDMRVRRALLARSLLAEDGQPQTVSDVAMDVLNTFELLGYLVRAGVLRLEDAWVNFSPWINNWWFIFEGAIHKIQREDDPTIYEDLSLLVDQFLNFEATKQSLDRSQLIPRPEDLSKFLEGEAGLTRRLEEVEEEAREAKDTAKPSAGRRRRPGR